MSESKTEKSFEALERLDRVVDNLIQDYGYDSKILEARVFLVWKDIVGGFVANNTEPSSLIEGKFRVWVKNSVLLSELHLLSRNLIEKINSKIGGNVVKELRFQLKQFSCSRQGNQPQEIAETDCKIGEIEIGQEVSQKINKAIQGVEDVELKRVLRRVFEKMGKRNLRVVSQLSSERG